MPADPVESSLLVFNDSSHAILRTASDGILLPSATGSSPEAAADAFARWTGVACKPVEIAPRTLAFSLVESEFSLPADAVALTLRQLGTTHEHRLHPALRQQMPLVLNSAIRIPYLNHGEHDFIYKFRTEKERNRDVYRMDPESQRLYHSELCQAIKALRRTRERNSSEPAVLDFGPIQYILPSHFGFCLGVQNAIERAYETLAAFPDRRVFMLSELIHNPFVNEDLLSRGLRYLQTDRGVHLTNPATGLPWWDELDSNDIVIIPAFGATDADKLRLIERGIPINRYDATCMLVEKVWKAARRFGREGYTVVIHGKAEHEETKATFSNTVRYAPCIVVRDIAEAGLLVDAIRASTSREKIALLQPLLRFASPGFDPTLHLRRLSVVNQTTLLRNETVQIINLLESALRDTYGPDEVQNHFASSSKGDTLCYATQVNQDALQRALALPADLAVVVGGRNSSNTVQLYKLCKARFGEKAFYIQSEHDIKPDGTVLHQDPSTKPKFGDATTETVQLIPAKQPVTVILTGGASCPDGLIQHVIARINSFFPQCGLRTPSEVIAALTASA